MSKFLLAVLMLLALVGYAGATRENQIPPRVLVATPTSPPTVAFYPNCAVGLDIDDPERYSEAYNGPAAPLICKRILSDDPKGAHSEPYPHGYLMCDGVFKYNGIDTHYGIYSTNPYGLDSISGHRCADFYAGHPTF